MLLYNFYDIINNITLRKQVIYLKKITKIEVQKKNKHRYSVYINDSFEFGINEEVLLKYGLEVGSEIDEYFIENILKVKNKVRRKIML